MKPPRLGEFGHLWAAKNSPESSLKLAPSMEVDGLGEIAEKYTRKWPKNTGEVTRSIAGQTGSGRTVAGRGDPATA
ncbi:hypothetical protein Q3G72_029454 [Acer saccharum]|nr:hypothetical protein Q3G72_029454 [Acer saccharum]